MNQKQDKELSKMIILIKQIIQRSNRRRKKMEKEKEFIIHFNLHIVEELTKIDNLSEIMFFNV